MESELFEEMFAPGPASAFYAHEFIRYFKMGSSKNFYWIYSSHPGKILFVGMLRNTSACRVQAIDHSSHSL